MFRCGRCDKLSSAREKSNKLIVKTRPQTYENILKDEKGNVKRDKEGHIVSKISNGTEIVKELTVCGTCNE